MRYAIVRGLARLLLAVFYRRLEIYGLERVPKRGPLIIAANHHNALVDAMLLVAMIPRPLAPLAKAPLFANPVIAPFLWLVGAIAVQRRQESTGEVSRNAAMFATATTALRRGEAILIFPEGISQPEPVLLPLRTGVARLALDSIAAAPDLDLTLLPVGLVFHQPADFRTGRGIVVVGEPIALTDLARRYRDAPAPAVVDLTARVASALRALIVEAADREMLRTLEVAEGIWRDAGDEASGAERLAWMREAMRRWNTLSPELRERAERLRQAIARYDKDVADAPRSPSRKPRALRGGLLMALGLPLALLGVALHAPGYRATAMTVRRLRPEPDESATYQLAAGLVLFPLSWILEAIVLGWLFGAGAVVFFAVVLIPTGFFALTWRARLQRFPREARAFIGVMRGAPPEERLGAQRQWLRDELVALDELTRTPDDGHIEPAS